MPRRHDSLHKNLKIKIPRNANEKSLGRLRRACVSQRHASNLEDSFLSTLLPRIFCRFQPFSTNIDSDNKRWHLPSQELPINQIKIIITNTKRREKTIEIFIMKKQTATKGLRLFFFWPTISSDRERRRFWQSRKRLRRNQHRVLARRRRKEDIYIYIFLGADRVEERRTTW